MAQRYVIENPGQQAELRPIASPVDTFAPPIIQAPEMKNIIDLAPLSKSFTDLASSMAAGIGEETLKAGGVAYSEAGADIKDALKGKDQKLAADKLAALARSKQIPEHYIPQFYRGIYEFAARDQMRSYESALKQEVDRATNVVDEQGNFMPEPAESAEQVAQRVWQEKFGQSPIFANYFGKQEAAKYKSNVEGNFVSDVTETRAKKLKDWRETKVYDELSSVLVNIGKDFDGTASAVQEKLSEMRTLGIPDINVKLTNAVLVAAQSKESAAVLAKDPTTRIALFNEARNILLAADDLQVGTTKLGDNVAMNDKLLSALSALEASEINAEERELRKTTRQRAEDQYALSQAGFSILDKLDRTLSPDARRTQFFAELDRQFGANEISNEYLMKARENYALVEKAEKLGVRTDEAVTAEIAKLVGEGNFDAADAVLNLAMREGRISGPDIETNKSRITGFRNAQQSVDNSPEYRAAKSTLEGIFAPLSIEFSERGVSNRLIADMKSISVELDGEMNNIVLSDMTPAEKKTAMADVVAKAKQRAADMQVNIERNVQQSHELLSKWQYGEVPATDADVRKAMDWLPKSEAAAYQVTANNYSTLAQEFINPTQGPLQTLYEGLRSAASLAAAELGEAAKASPDIQAYGAVTTEAVRTEIARVYREEVRKGTPVMTIHAMAADAGRKVAIAKLDELKLLDPTVDKIIRNALLEPAVAYKAGQKDAMQTRINNANRALDHLQKSQNSMWFGVDETFVMDITQIPQTIGVSELDNLGILERIGENLRDSYGEWSILSREELLADVTSHIDNYELMRARPEELSEIVSRTLAHTGITLQEALTGEVLHNAGLSEMANLKLDTAIINPWYTPMLLDADKSYGMRRGQGAQTQADVNDWFALTELPDSDEAAQLAQIFKKFGIPDTEDMRVKFRDSQIKAHSRLLLKD